MKSNLILCLAFALLIACGNNKAAQETTVADTKQQSQTSATTTPDQPSNNGIVGNWKLTLEAYDDNSNKILDDEERKKGIKNGYAFHFSADGSCQIQQVYKGRYEIKTEGDKKILYVYRNRVVGEEEKDPPPDIYRIISMNKNELVLLEQEGNLTFWVFQRVS